MVNNSINQLLFNALAQHQTVVLPGMGSLRFKRVSTKMDRTTLTPPRNMIRYSSRNEGVSLPEMIVAASGCSREEGEEAYRRWLRRVKDNHVVDIEGVGRIEKDFFKASDELEKLLNPIALAPLTLHRRRSFKGVWISLGVVAVAAVAGGVWWYMNNQSPVVPMPTPAPNIVEQTVEDVIAEDVDSMVVESESVSSVVEDAAVPDTIVPAPAAEEIGTMTSGMNYAVLGVFSTEENVRKFIEQMSRRSPEIICRAYKFQGSKFMVSGCESTDAAAVSAFIRANRAKYPDLWSYTCK